MENNNEENKSDSPQEKDEMDTPYASEFGDMNDAFKPVEVEDVQEVESSDLTPEKKSTTTAIQNMLESMLKVTGDNKILVEPSCPICMSSLREEAEELYEQNHSAIEIKKLYKEKLGTTINKAIVDNHMDNHVHSNVQELQKVEYINTIKNIQEHHATTLEYLDFSLSVLTERLMGVNSITPGPNETIADIEKIKTSETTKIANKIKDIAKTRAELLGEMADTGEVVTIPSKDFVKVFHEAMASCETSNEKRIVRKILDRFSSINV